MKYQTPKVVVLVSALLLMLLTVLAACGEVTVTLPPATNVVVTPPSIVPTTFSTPTLATIITTAPSFVPARPSLTTTNITTSQATAVTTSVATVNSTTTAANDITPPPLGIAENALKATGFDADDAKHLLDELTTEVGVRVVGTDGEKKAADWLEKYYKSYGYTNVQRQKFSFQTKVKTTPTISNSKEGQNIIVVRPGPKPDAPILIFGGHYDSVAGTVGASDNGSGTVITLELAKTLFKKFPGYELRFINFSGEEIGVVGSIYYVSQLSEAEKKRIVAYINLDALGVGDRFVAIGTNELVYQAVDVATQTGVRLEAFNLNGTGAGSDHWAFIDQGIKSVFLARWIDPLLHKPGDTPDRVYPQALLLAGGMAILVAQRLTTP